MKVLKVVILLILAVTAEIKTQDIEGSGDHPIISRYPGSEIKWFNVDNYREFKLPIGPVTGYRNIDDWIETEGKVTRIYYALDGGDRTHSEVYKNYKDALENAGMEILADGLLINSSRKGEIGSRAWQEVYFIQNPFTKEGAAREMVSGSSSSGGSGTLIAKKERAGGTVYVAVSVYHFRSDRVSTLVDVVEVEEAETGFIIVNAEAIGKGISEHGRVVLDGILFDFDKATLKPESKEAFNQIVKYLEKNPGKNFFVVGHTDSKGKFEYNRDLSSKRAKAVVESLVNDYKIKRSRLEAHGVGPLVPVFTNSSDAGREKNRRVELVER
jgi:outer membrane protein OmpA-like peptidoglycan-associated protein